MAYYIRLQADDRPASDPIRVVTPLEAEHFLSGVISRIGSPNIVNQLTITIDKKEF